MHNPLPNLTPPRRNGFDAALLLTFAVSLALVGLASGCKLIQGAAELPGTAMRVVLPGRTPTNGVNVVDLQEKLIRFTEEYIPRQANAIDQLRLGTNALDRADVLQRKIAFAAELMSIASGPNSVANTLDMVVVITLARLTVENYVIPDVCGESARPMLAVLKDAETDAWRVAHLVFEPQMLAELRTAIDEYHAAHPRTDDILYVRAIDFPQAAKAMPVNNNSRPPASIFSFLKFDPLAGLDPATREIAETRLFAERALFTAQQMPTIIRWQAELLAAQTTALPDVRQVVTNSTQLAAAAANLSRTMEKLPGQISAEREKIVEALQSQTPGLTALTTEAKQTLVAGAQMASNLNTALGTFDGVLKTLDAAAGPPDANSPPFHIQDYTTAAAQIDATAQHLTELLVQFNNTVSSTNLAALSAQVTPVVNQAQIGGKDLVDYAFRKAIVLLLVGCGLLLLTGLLYRWIKLKLLSDKPGAT